MRWIAYPLVWPLGLGVTGFFARAGAAWRCRPAILLIAIQKLIAETVAEEQTGAAKGAAFFAAGMCMATVTLLSGPLYDRLGADGFFAMIGVAALGLRAGQLLAQPQPQSAGSGGDTSEPLVGQRRRAVAGQAAAGRRDRRNRRPCASSTAGAMASDVPTMQPTMMAKPAARAASRSSSAAVSPPALSSLMLTAS